MSQRILVFEADSDFAKEVESNFTSLGTEVEVVADGTIGLERAAQDKPDLILLSIELPSMNGFLVCKKIKKNAALKDVPLVILSSDANAEEIFEQHKKLRTRAEDYIRKPISFTELLSRIQQLVPIEANGGASPIEISEEIAIDEAPEEARGVDDEIDAFADSAFESLMLGEEGPESAAEQDVSSEIEEVRAESEPAPRSVAPEAAEASPLDVDMEDVLEVEPEELEAEPAEVPGEISKVQKAPPPGEADESMLEELEASRQRIASLEAELGQAQRRASDADRLDKEVAELRTKVGKSGGISSREFLDLREALNKKDKEILDLRDQVSQRDKQMLDLRDKSLVLEREKADFEDKQVALERAVADSEEKIQQLTRDKDAATKRAEDLRSRGERAEEKARKLGEELDAERASRKSELDALKAKHAEEKTAIEEKLQEQSARAAAKHAHEMDTLRESHFEELERLREEHGAALKNAEANHKSQLEQKLTEAEEATKAELAEVRAQLGQELETALEEAEQQRQSDLAKAAADKEAAVSALRTELESEHDARVKELEEKHSKDLSLLGRRLSETESSLEQTTERLKETEAERDSAREELEARTAERDGLSAELAAKSARIGELEGETAALKERVAALEETQRNLEAQVDRANTKIATDAQLLERARKAMAIGLGLLEDQKNNRLEG